MSNIPDTNDELQAEYQFDYSTGVRGKYYEQGVLRPDECLEKSGEKRLRPAG